MKRSDFLKSLLTIVAAPSVLINTKTENMVKRMIGVSQANKNKQYISAISFLDKREIDAHLYDLQNEKGMIEIMEVAGRNIK